jgi:hypothetical protein
MRVCRLALVLLLAAGCHSTLSGHDAGVGELDQGVPVEDAGDAGLDAAPGDLACTPVVTSCVGLCGPIFDSCTGKNVQCGGCDAGKVCNLVTHACEVPKTDCAAMGAQCGNVRNSCGTRLFCGDCAAGQECDPDTNTCVSCQNVTCEQLGYECGQAWLGCGNQATTPTDCGACPAGATPVCNPYFNVCEPSCTPAAAATICAAAQQSRGVECGIISDGCGGYVDCGGCAAGFACGAQGDPNRCEPKELPTECAAAGRNCGTITSVCGGTVNCGSCTAPEVCNANGVCGAPCAPKDCAALGNPACGLVDDGCGGMKKCNDCPDSSYACLANHTCCKKKSCAADYAGKCGAGLDDGCGGTIDCGCASGSCTATMSGAAGTCCVNTASCPAGACNTSVTDTCTGKPIACTCDSQHWCDGSNMCEPKKSCGDYLPHVPGQAGDECSNGGAYDSGGGAMIACPCTAGEYCIDLGGTVVTGGNKGTCCVDTACQGQPCGASVMNSCTHAAETCGCPSGQFCSGGTCMALNTCATYGANHKAGDPCSNGANPNWPKGNGTNLTCKCTDGSICYTPGGGVATGTQEGVCCKNTAVCAPNTCNTTVTNSCTGLPIACACDSAHWCDTGTNTCQAKKKCSDYGANGAPSDACGSFSDGSASGTINCPCSTLNGQANNMCVNGTCQCTPSACTDCSQNGSSDGCGGTKSCACGGATPVCFPSAGGANGCCAPYSCSSLPPGVPATTPPPPAAEHPVCGVFNDHCGASFNCACGANNPATMQPWPNVTCAPQGGSPAYGFCMCTPTPCAQLGAGPHDNDGCGHFVNCGS